MGLLAEPRTGRAPWGTLFMNFALGPGSMASIVGPPGRSARARPKMRISTLKKGTFGVWKDCVGISRPNLAQSLGQRFHGDPQGSWFQSPNSRTARRLRACRVLEKWAKNGHFSRVS